MLLAASWLGTPTAAAADHIEYLESPRRLKAGNDWVDSEIGHAAPYIADFDHDGKRDLLVGQFGEGKLRFYKNLGSNSAPEYAQFRYFQIDKKDVTVPTG